MNNIEINEKRIQKRIISDSLFFVIEDQININFASLDFNSYGVGILSDLDFKVGDIIILTLGNDDGFIIENIKSQIKNKINLDVSEFRYGLQFLYEDLTEDKINQLKNLEKILMEQL